VVAADGNWLSPRGLHLHGRVSAGPRRTTRWPPSRHPLVLRRRVGQAIDVVWDAIALHTTPGIPQHKKPEVALVTAGVEMDVLGLGYLDVPDAHREGGSQRASSRGSLQGADHPRLSRWILPQAGDHLRNRERRRARAARPDRFPAGKRCTDDGAYLLRVEKVR
jgi:hypothetical protein